MSSSIIHCTYGTHGPHGGCHGRGPHRDGCHGPHEGRRGPHDGGYHPHEGGHRPHEGRRGPHDGGYHPHEGGHRPHEGRRGPHDGGYHPHEGGHRPHEGDHGRGSHESGRRPDCGHDGCRHPHEGCHDGCHQHGPHDGCHHPHGSHGHPSYRIYCKRPGCGKDYCVTVRHDKLCLALPSNHDNHQLELIKKPVCHDNSVLWSENGDISCGFKYLRTHTDHNMVIDAWTGDIHDGTQIGTYPENHRHHGDPHCNADNQLWKFVLV
ncbi:uncharacterized protein LOC141596078 isoform X2 [Silene latifolia]|uniref:uncharacterized protein LOC141596078 isoform X2 n=1 Tax=Silene latifolia TaxID=37657 RepID=UPI003D789B1E